MIGVSTPIFDIEGARIFRRAAPASDQDNRQGSRRVSRTKTLDGGVVITDGGYCDGDRDIAIEEPEASLAAVEFARYVVETYSDVMVTMDDGVYNAAPQSYELKAGTLVLKLWIMEKLS